MRHNLAWMWVLAIPLSYFGKTHTLQKLNKQGGEPFLMPTIYTWETLLPVLIPTFICFLVGMVAICRTGEGMWANKSPNEQAAGVFASSLLFAVGLVTVYAGLMDLPIQEEFGGGVGNRELDLPLFALIYLGVGLCTAFLTFGVGFPGLIPPLILCVLVFRQRQISLNMFYFLGVVATIAWLGTAIVGYVMNAPDEAIPDGNTSISYDVLSQNPK